MSVQFLRDQGLAPTLFFHNPNIHPLSEYLRRREGLLNVAARMGVAVLLADQLRQAGPDQPDSPDTPASADLSAGLAAGLGFGPAAAHPGPWLSAMAALGPGMDDMTKRCPRCYELRFTATARVARALGYVRFTSTLLYSRYQNRKALLAEGERQAGPDLAFLPEDFRPGLLEGVRLSKQWGIYRQQYCGCMLSEHERYKRLIEIEKPKRSEH